MTLPSPGAEVREIARAFTRVATRAASCAVLCAGLLASGCAQQVGDIDRTQPNRMKKAELVGTEWFMAQTVTEVPATSWFTFPGETSTMERVRWEIREDKVIAYRVYSKLEGGDPDLAREGDTYTESPVAAFPVVSHFDIQRQYSTTTGEQSNVIVENSSDRPWFERDYIRVDWSNNILANFDFIATPAYVSGVSYFVLEEQGGADAMVTDRGADGKLGYFDVTSKIAVEPDYWGCLFAYYGWSAEDCTAAEIKVRTSFKKAESVREYEPVQYNDRLMSKFGYFRTERFGFDPWRGIRQGNRVQLANRHPIWEKVWQRDEDGAVKRDADGRPLALPMKDRVPKPIVYYASSYMPESIIETSKTVGASWDQAFREAVAVAQGKSAADVRPMFVVCHNPVAEGDDEACGEVGLSVRMGDIRYNHMVWVDRPTQAGLLGYGPSGADPLTGEIVFGAAYVYGTEVDTYAQYAVDLVRLMNGELTDEDLKVPTYIRDEILNRLKQDPSRPAVTGNARVRRPTGLKRAKPGDVTKLLPARKAARLRQIKRIGLEPSRVDMRRQRLQKIADAGLDSVLLDDEQVRGMSRGTARHAADMADLSERDRARLMPTQWASADAMKTQRQQLMKAAKNNMYLSAFVDDAVVGLAKEVKDRSPEEVRELMRKAIYRAVMEHEVGHTIGLRHNFQGSYDALNFFDEYWDLRKENIKLDPTLDDLYTMSAPTQAQKDGRMQEYAYSSIMDYGMRFNSDVHGIGKYDRAAILFGYTTGTHDSARGVEPGFVYTYDNPGDALTLLKRYEDPASLAESLLLEEYHYTSVALAFPSLDAMKARTPMRYSEVLERREKEGLQAPVEVHHMFCSDEWVGATLSCMLFDAGADPFEIAKHTINNYREYYALNHWSRDRTFFWSENVLNSMYGRYFTQLTHVYQQWVFAYFYGTADVTQDNYYLFAGMAGFNLLADVLKTPAIGSYAKGDDGIFRLSAYTTEAGPNDELFLGYDQAHEVYTEFEYDTGYYYYERAHHVGHFWDYLAALFALTDSEATRLGVDAAADIQAYSIPWYMFFEYELTEIMAGTFARDAKTFAPRVKDGKRLYRPSALLVTSDENDNEVYFDPETGKLFPVEPEGDPVELDTSYTQELYGVLYGMAFFTSNFSLSFPDQWRVFQVGSGEEIEAGPGYKTVTFTDPYTGITYGAITPNNADDVYSGAALLIKKANEFDQIVNTSDDEDAVADAAYYRQDMVDRINMVRSLYQFLGTVY